MCKHYPYSTLQLNDTDAPKLGLTAIASLKERVELRFIILERLRLYPYCCNEQARFIEEGYSFLEEKRDQLQGTEVAEGDREIPGRISVLVRGGRRGSVNDIDS